jgi:hypothetical protein
MWVWLMLVLLVLGNLPVLGCDFFSRTLTFPLTFDQIYPEAQRAGILEGLSDSSKLDYWKDIPLVLNNYALLKNTAPEKIFEILKKSRGVRARKLLAKYVIEMGTQEDHFVLEKEELRGLEQESTTQLSGRRGNMAYLIAALYNLSHLKSLHLDFSTRHLSALEIKNLGSALASFKSLKDLYLNFSSSALQEEELAALGKLLENIPTLQSLRLGLSHNALGGKNFESLGDAFSNIHHLKECVLDFSQNTIEANQIQALGKGLGRLSYLHRLYIDFSQSSLNDTSASALVAILRKIPSLDYLGLGLDQNNISADSQIKLIRIISDIFKAPPF